MTQAKRISGLSPRARANYLAACARYQAAQNKPLERRRVQSFMFPITQAFNQMMTGEVDVHAESGLPITRHNNKGNWEETHKCINGVVAAMERLLPDVDLDTLRWVSSDLAKGKLMTEKKVMAAKRTFKEIEDRMTRCTWDQVTDATRTTQIEIELEHLGLKKAA